MILHHRTPGRAVEIGSGLVNESEPSAGADPDQMESSDRVKMFAKAGD
jgi:hypothetical protein